MYLVYIAQSQPRRIKQLITQTVWMHSITLVTQPNSYKVFALWTKDTQSSRYYTKVVLSAQD